MDQPDSRPKHPCIRRDGWTVERQLAFLAALKRTRSVTRAARTAGMSRESAYRLRARPQAALFAAAWDRALRVGSAAKVTKVTRAPARFAAGQRSRAAYFAEIRQSSRNS